MPKRLCCQFLQRETCVRTRGAASWAQSTREEHHLHEMAVGQVEKERRSGSAGRRVGKASTDEFTGTC